MTGGMSPPAWVLSFPTRPADCPAVNGISLRAVGTIAALEELLDIPILTANQVLLWHAMQLTGSTTPLPGYGMLVNMHHST